MPAFYIKQDTNMMFSMKEQLTLLVTFLLAVSLSAQVTVRPQIGFNASSITENLPEEVLDGKTAINFGVDVQFGGRFYFQPGLMYETRKADVKPEDRNIASVNLRVNRVRIPALIGYNLTGEPEQFLNIRAFTGPDISFAVNKDVDDNQLSFDEEDIKNFVWGWNVGAGVDIAFLFVDIGYQFGLSNILENVEANPKNNLFYINGGLSLRF